MRFFPCGRAGYFLLFLCTILFLSNESYADRKKKNKEAVVKTIYEIDTLKAPIPRQRIFFHEKVVKALVAADWKDGVKDHYISMGDDTLSSQVISQAILRDAAHIDTMIENLPIADKQTDNQTKIFYLNALTNLINHFNNDSKVDPFYYKRLVANHRNLIIARQENRLMEFVQANANIYTLANVELLKGFPEARSYVYSAVGREYPLMMIRRLSEFANEPFADSIIIPASRIAPNEIYNYATSTNFSTSGAIQRSKDSLVQAIVRITKQSKAPLKAMSFLSDIYNHRKTIAEIDAITANQDLFYKNLVRLKLAGDTLGGTTYTEELQYRGIKYVRTVNELHDNPSPIVRFKCIEGFTPEELYFLIVYGQDEIYTSSFIGIFDRMMERLKPQTGDQLFDKVHFEHFRTFIRMSAGYGKLDEFLATVPADKKTSIMKDFIANLEKGKEYELEDAVDVADAYGSLKDSVLKTFLQQEVLNNYKRVSEMRSTKGLIVYGLLSTIFKGGAPDSLSKSLGLPPINLVPYHSLAGDTGVVFEQFFFYGDEDGKSSYASFLTNFKDGNWKVTDVNKNWIVINSIKGKPVVIYANKPIAEPEGADEVAQKALQSFLDSQHISPTFVVHRGHSYHLSGTIEQLRKQSRIVMLGSCGGYHNLGQVLDHSPDAQIISTKQVGTMSVNEPIIQAINTKMLAGSDIDWIQLWDDLEIRLRTKGGEPYKFFQDYVPPHRNLGAIFIKAYRRISNLQESQG